MEAVLKSFAENQKEVTLTVCGASESVRYRRGRIAEVGQDVVVLKQYKENHFVIGEVSGTRKRKSDVYIHLHCIMEVTCSVDEWVED